MCMGSSPSKPSKSEMDYRAEDDFRTMQRAEEIRSDNARHTRALAHGRKTISAMTKVVRGKAMRAPRRPSARRG